MHSLGVTTRTTPLSEAEVSADGRVIVFQARPTQRYGPGSVWTVTSDGSGLRRIVSSSRGGFWALSGNGQYVLIEGGKRLVPVQGGRARLIRFDEGVHAPVIAYDGSVFVPDTRGISWLRPTGRTSRVRTVPARLPNVESWTYENWSGRRGQLAYCDQLGPVGSGAPLAFGVLNKEQGTLRVRNTGIATRFLSTCVVSKQGTVGTVIETPTGRFEFVTYSTQHGIHRFAVQEFSDEPEDFSPDGRYAAALPSRTKRPQFVKLPQRELVIFNVHNGRRQRSAPLGSLKTSFSGRPAWLDARTVAIATQEERGRATAIQFVDAVSGRSIRVRLPTALVSDARLSMVATPDGERVIALIDRAGRDDWFSVGRDGTVVRLTNDAVRLGSDGDAAGPIFAGGRVWMIGGNGDLYWTEANGFGETPLSYSE